jgi:hypothetical protein
MSSPYPRLSLVPDPPPGRPLRASDLTPDQLAAWDALTTPDEPSPPPLTPEEERVAARNARVRAQMWVPHLRDPFWVRFWERMRTPTGERLEVGTAAAEFRLWEAVHPWPKEDDWCRRWIWSGAVNGRKAHPVHGVRPPNLAGRGYAWHVGIVTSLSKPLRVHRVAWSFFHRRPVPWGYEVVHAEWCRAMDAWEPDHQLCCWGGGLQLQPGRDWVSPREGISTELDDPDVEQPLFRNEVPMTHPVTGRPTWRVTSYTRQPRYLLVDELTETDEILERQRQDEEAWLRVQGRGPVGYLEEPLRALPNPYRQEEPVPVPSPWEEMASGLVLPPAQNGDWATFRSPFNEVPPEQWSVDLLTRGPRP